MSETDKMIISKIKKGINKLEESNDHLECALYASMRTQIITWSLMSDLRDRFTDHYVFAWLHGVYPVLEELDGIHTDFADYFSKTEEMMKELLNYLDESYNNGDAPKFVNMAGNGFTQSYEWSPTDLMFACWYLKIGGKYDDNFWDDMLTPPKDYVPISNIYERDNILGGFDRTEIKFPF